MCVYIYVSKYMCVYIYIHTENNKASTANDTLSVIWKSDLPDKIKHRFFQAVIMSILLYGCTTWTLTKRIEKKHGDTCTRMQ